MTHNPYAATTAVDTPAGDPAATMFYVVSRRKAAILFLGTVGYYGFYWFYKQWDCYRDGQPYASKGGSSIWPVPRALFSVFFFHALFRAVREHGREHAAVAAWRHNLHASVMVVLTLVSSALDRAANKSIGSPTTDVLSLLMLVPLLFGMLRAQDAINLACGDPRGDSNDRFTAANHVWLAIGGLLWGLILVGFRG